MIGKKLLKIDKCYYNLPDNFNGTLGEALLLLANYRLEKERKNKISDNTDVDDWDSYTKLMENDEAKCTVEYALCKLSDDKTKWENL